jgi:Leucine-rich repeat (LRR) protein
MLKNILIILSICILFFGCNSSKKTTEYTINDGIVVKEEDNEIIAEFEDVEKRETINEDDPYFFYIENYFETLDINITELYISQLDITDISPITKFQNLERLTIRNLRRIENFDPIFDLIGLKRLVIIFQPLFALTNIGKLVNLEYLEFDFSFRITKDDLITLTNLKQLKELIIDWPDFDDISPLLELPNLERLTLGCTKDYKVINIMPLLESNSLWHIEVDFITWGNYLYFENNEKKIFEERGIYVYPFDMR